MAANARYADLRSQLSKPGSLDCPSRSRVSLHRSDGSGERVWTGESGSGDFGDCIMVFTDFVWSFAVGTSEDLGSRLAIVEDLSDSASAVFRGMAFVLAVSVALLSDG